MSKTVWEVSLDYSATPDFKGAYKKLKEASYPREKFFEIDRKEDAEDYAKEVEEIAGIKMEVTECLIVSFDF